MKQPSSLLLAASSMAIFWQRLWRRLWPAASIAGMFVAVALMGFLPSFAGWLHGLILLLFALLTVGALIYAFRGLKLVDGATALRRLEKDSGLDHRPLSALEDNLATGSETLWHLHLRRMAESARKLRLRLPSPELARHDPYGFRVAVLLLLVVGLAAAGGEAPQRLSQALTPNIFAAAAPPAVDAWITPPDYTGRPRIYLDGKAVEAPVGAALLIQVSGVKTAPRLKLAKTAIEFTAIGRDTFKAEASIEEDARISVQYDGAEIAAWPVKVIADAPPTVKLLNDPAASKGRLLRLKYEAKDDYGVTEAVAVIRLSGTQNELRLTLPFSGRGKNVVKGRTLKDLTAHAWAGLEASLRLEATDARGQKGQSETVDLLLPERLFNHPVAREIIAARKKLADPSLENYQAAAMDLEDITAKPERFSNDTVVYLALRVAMARLDFDRQGKAHESVRQILWSAALRLEDGGVSIAENNLRTAREELMEALRQGADPKEIEALMDQLQRSLGAYLNALMKNFKNLNAPPELGSMAMDLIEGSELQDLINQARELARAGDIDAARQMLSALSKILESIQAGVQGGDISEEIARAGRFLNEARRLAKRQQKITDETFKRMRKDQEKRRRAEKYLEPDMGDGGRSQDALRKDLDKLMEKFGEAMGDLPRSLGTAELDMREAVEALKAKQDRAALAAQSRALGNLRQGTKEMGELLAKRLGERSKMMMGRGGGRDPFGRRPGTGGSSIAGSQDLPGRTDAGKAGKILRELRRRAGQRQRRQEELDYIQRLLKLF